MEYPNSSTTGLDVYKSQPQKLPAIISNEGSNDRVYSRSYMFLPPPMTSSNRKVYRFEEKDLDAVLYGYFKEKHKLSNAMMHSLSGVLTMNGSRLRTSNGLVIPHPKLPPSLQIKEIVAGLFLHKGVFATDIIPAGKIYGPYTGMYSNFNKCNTTKCNCAHSWEVYKDGKVMSIIDGSGDPDNWMKYVNCARYDAEQNLALIQTDTDLFYKATRTIHPGEELLVWYGDEYVTYMGVPISRQKIKKVIQPAPIDKKAVVQPSGHFPCDRCGKIFSYEYYREKHLKYTRCVDMGDRKFPCHLCDRSFEKKDRLRIHVLHVHQKYRPHVCTTCGKRFSQSSSLNKHSRVHTGERPYACPHCPKAFTASSILRTHLRQHNGERPFKCKFCGKAFASHAAHDSHVRRTHGKMKKHSCKICTKSFATEYELKFHLNSHEKMIESPSSDLVYEKSLTMLDANEVINVSPQNRSFSVGSEDSLIIDV